MITNHSDVSDASDDSDHAQLAIATTVIKVWFIRSQMLLIPMHRKKQLNYSRV